MAEPRHSRPTSRCRRQGRGRAGPRLDRRRVNVAAGLDPHHSPPFCSTSPLTRQNRTNPTGASDIPTHRSSTDVESKCRRTPSSPSSPFCSTASLPNAPQSHEVHPISRQTTLLRVPAGASTADADARAIAAWCRLEVPSDSILTITIPVCSTASLSHRASIARPQSAHRYSDTSSSRQQHNWRSARSGSLLSGARITTSLALSAPYDPSTASSSRIAAWVSPVKTTPRMPRARAASTLARRSSRKTTSSAPTPSRSHASW